MSCSPSALSRRAIRSCVFVATTAFMCAALLTVAVLAPAPPVALPLVVAVCIGLPMAAAFELPSVVAVVRQARERRRDLDVLRRQLRALPETHHPLGL